MTHGTPTLQITVLVKNTAGGRGLLGEHGIAFLLETDRYHLLFDTGQAMALPYNARQLGISLRNLDAIVLSQRLRLPFRKAPVLTLSSGDRWSKGS